MTSLCRTCSLRPPLEVYARLCRACLADCLTALASGAVGEAWLRALDPAMIRGGILDEQGVPRLGWSRQAGAAVAAIKVPSGHPDHRLAYPGCPGCELL